MLTAMKSATCLGLHAPSGRSGPVGVGARVRAALPWPARVAPFRGALAVLVVTLIGSFWFNGSWSSADNSSVAPARETTAASLSVSGPDRCEFFFSTASFDQMARRSTRRPLEGPLLHGLPPVAAAGTGAPVAPDSGRPARPFSPEDSLAKCWQFHWRTASPPRAPSCAA